jgi:Na+-transporting NADH:ubiquinone oxidoreductase subunit F
MEPWTIVLLGVGMFAGVILSQVGILLAAKRMLVQSGRVRLEVNDDPDNAMEVEGGSTLLTTLASQKVFIPSACGGKGTCGVCKVEVHEGGGALLPTEQSHVSPKEARAGTRLSCQVKVKGDMKIAVPPEVFSVRKWRCRVRSNRNVATFIKELVLDLPEGEQVPFRAGGYVQVECKPHAVYYKDFDIDEQYREEWSKYHLFALASTSRETVTRAYSMASYPDEKGIIMLNIRIASPPMDAMHVPPGQMSSYLFNLKPCDEVTISGPFGEFFARDTDSEMCFIGGGAGMAPMRSHIYDQFLRLQTTRKASFWYGARSLREAFYVEEFDDLQAAHDSFEWQLVLSHPKDEDHWEGPTGWVHDALRTRYLEEHPAPEDIEYYLCGPPAMIDSVVQMLYDLGVEPENILFDDFG